MWDAKASCQDEDQGSDGLYCSGTSGAGTSYRSTILVDRGLKDILDHNLKETFYVNVVALTTWVGYDCCADIPYSEDIHESHYDCQQDIQSAKD